MKCLLWPFAIVGTAGAAAFVGDKTIGWRHSVQNHKQHNIIISISSCSSNTAWLYDPCQARCHPTALCMAGKKAVASEPAYWIDVTDHVAIVNDGDNRRIKFTIRGNPKVLVRHRTARGFMYNPSKAAQDLFRDCLLEALPQEHHPVIIDSGDSDLDIPTVMFPENQFLKLSLTFRMKRPNNHFIGSKPGTGRLKPNAPRKYYNNRSGDVDNLCKFVMDSLNQVLYADDRQVVCLNAIKLLDSDGDCKGSTDVEISTLNDEDENNIIL
mmetsp:Transcript_26996/g.42353  ORF Transcript_26996/g.42353 Transcript_26996/m.42353 type:complete len:268 (+) Transcript_26996:145-948(+)